MRKFSVFILSVTFFCCNLSFAQYQFIAPLPGSVDHNPDRNIIIREGSLIDAGSLDKKKLFSITGTISGNHEFDVVLCRDSQTILLNPVNPFTEGETVEVSIGKGLKRANGTMTKEYNFHFSIHRKYNNEDAQRLSNAREEVWVNEFGSRDMNSMNQKPGPKAGASLPPMFITTNTNPAPGEIFFHNYNFYAYQTYHHCIMTNDGDSIYSSGADGHGWDFKINRNGYLTMFNKFPAKFLTYDSSFNEIGSYGMQNGYLTDIHDFQSFPDGHYYLQGYSYTFKDLTVYDPTYNPNATIVGLVVQKFDKDKNLLFEWRSLDHIPVIEAPHATFTSTKIDYVHGNSIEEDLDGNLIISCRHLDQVNKIDVSTGKFVWRLGGVKNEFTLVNDSIWFTYQHDVRRLPNGHITMFDNGNYHGDLCSYAREYELDEVNKIATLAWAYKHPPINGENVYGSALGSVQRLSNGNTFINWGGILPGKDFPNLTEVTPDGEIVWEMHLKDKYNDVMYRAHKYEWDPCARTLSSKLKAKDITGNSANLNWFDANGATAYKVQYRQVGETTWQNRTIDDGTSSKIVKKLLPQTNYEWHVKTICSNGITSPYSEIAMFVTLPLKVADGLTMASFRVYPNPSSDEIRIQIPEDLKEPVYIQLVSMLGAVMYQSIFEFKAAGNPLKINVKDLPVGLYSLIIFSGKMQWVEKIAVE